MLLSVPHSGRDYPDWLLGLASAGKASLTSLEDPLVDRLVWRAMQRGCGAVIARTPRAAIDCNRAEDEVDPSVIDGARRGKVTARARGGLGIVPARTQQHGYLWRRADFAGAAGRADRPGAPALSRGDRGAARASARPLRLRAPARLPFDAAAAGRRAAGGVRRLPRPDRRAVAQPGSDGDRPPLRVSRRASTTRLPAAT